MPRDADRGVCAPEPECRRDWVPVEAPKRRRSPKYVDEPVRRAETGKLGAVDRDGSAGGEVPLDRSGGRSTRRGDA